MSRVESHNPDMNPDNLTLNRGSPPKAAQRRSSDSSRSTARTPQSRMPPGTAAARPARPA